jgi:hypothetical protein
MFLKRLREQSHGDRGRAVAKMERDCQDDIAVFASHSGVSETITGLELMRSGPNNRRPRGRGNPGRGNNNRQQRNNNVDSNGPDVKVRGTPQQVVDKYQTLAREATTAGDPVRAENYYQHAEHYYRVLSANAAANQEKQQRDNRNDRSNGATESNAANGAEENGNYGNGAAAVEQLAPNTNGEAEAEKVDATGDPAEADEATVERIEVVQEPVAEEPEETAPA